MEPEAGEHFAVHEQPFYRHGFFLTFEAAGVIGGASASIALTGIAYSAGEDHGRPASFAGALLATISCFAIVAIPFGSTMIRRFGNTRSYSLVCAVAAIGYLLLAVAMMLGVNQTVAAFAAAPVIGAVNGLFLATSQQALASFSAENERARLLARLAMASGIASAICLPLMGALIDAVGPQWVLLIDGFIFLPQMIFCWHAKPGLMPARPAKVHHRWRALREALKAEPRLRRAATVVAFVVILIAPIQTMVVPVAKGLGYSASAAAGLLAGCMALGAVLTPIVVHVSHRVWPTRLEAGAKLYAASGMVITIAGLIALFLQRWIELGVICGLLFMFGAFRMSGMSTMRGEAGSIGPSERSALHVSAYSMVSALCVPVGVVVWGILLDFVGVEACLITAGLLAALLIAGLGLRAQLRHRKSEGDHLPSN